MAYADPLDQDQPAGNSKRKLGDDFIRQHVRAVRQRLASVFVDVDADPLVLKVNAVSSGVIVDLAITTAKVADRAITQIKHGLLSVGTPELIDLAVVTGKIADAAITTAKLGLLSVGAAQIIDRAVTSVKIALLAVLPEHIGAGTFNFDSLTVAGVGPLGQFLVGTGAGSAFRAIVSSDLPASADGAQAYRVGNLDLVQNVLTAIDFDGEEWDTGGVHDNAVNPSRLVAPVNGRYLLIAGLTFAGIAADVFAVIRKNGVAVNLDRADLHTVGSSVGNIRLATVQTLVAGDYVQVLAQTNIVANPDIIGGAEYTHFSMVRQT